MRSLIFLLSLIVLTFLFASCEKDVVFNKVPVANAGAPANITLPINTVTLTGAGSDADGSVVAYLWSQVSGPAESVIVNPGSPSTAINNLVQGTYIFQLMVTDDEGATGVDTLQVKVNPNPNPNPIVLTLQPTNNPTEKVLINYNGQDASSLGIPELLATAWTFNSLPHNGKTLLKYDLSSIPANATVQSAHLYLYSSTPPDNGNKADANFGTNNSMWLQQVTSNWNPASVGWFNAPTTTTTGQINIPHTAQSVLDLDIDVTSLVSTMVSSGTNYGFMLRLQNETLYTSRIFVSSSHPTKTTKYPKLVVTYK